MIVGERAFDERKAAGDALIALARYLKPKKAGATVTVGTIGGFAMEARTTHFEEVELRLVRAVKGAASHCKSVRGSSLMFGRARFVLVEL